MASIIERHDRDGNVIGYRAAVRRKGHPAQVRTFRRKQEAERWARAVEHEIDEGKFVDRRPAENTTLDQLLDRYVREITPSKRGADAERSKIRVVRSHSLARKTVASITGADLADYRDDRLQHVSPGTVNRELNLLSHTFTIAQKEWRIPFPAGNPVAAMRRPRTSDARTRRLEPGEEERLLAAAEEYEQAPRAIRLAAIIRLALCTAMRRGEIAAMRWEHVDLRGRTIHVPRSKNGEARSVPLSRVALDVLEGLPRRIDGWVWGRDLDPHTLTRAFTRVCQRAGIRDLRLHDLRHEAVSRFFVSTDMTEMEIARVSGHRTWSMLSRYTHLRAGDLADRLDGLRRGSSGVT